MKKLLFVIICLSIVSVSVFAQQRGNRRTPEESAKQTTEWMKTELKLTDKQIAPVDEINLVYAKAAAKLRENATGGGDFASMREPMQKLEEERVKSFEKVLTKEQLESYKKLAAERRPRPGGGGQGGGNRRNR